MATLRHGQRLGDRFVVQGVLGRGGMATVYLVEDEHRAGRVALKVLHEHLAHDPAMIDRLRREVAAASRVRHPNALCALDLHRFDDTWALSMPYHPGQTLAEAVAQHGALSADAVRRLGEQLADALAAAHSRGVLHRDVSPANVMLDERGDAQLTDFGLARVRDDRTRHSTGMMGTAGFTAPEVWAGTRTDPRSDLYSLGAVLYQAATGTSAFDSEPMAALQQQLGERWTPLSEARPDLPEDLRQTIEALLAHDVDRRPASAQEVAAALRDGVAAAAETPSAPAVTRAGGELVLPKGEWAVACKPPRDERRRRRHLARRAEREGLAQALSRDAPELLIRDAVARLAGVSPDAVAPTRALLSRDGFRMVSGVDEATAQRAADAAQMAGFETTILSSRPAKWRSALSFAPILIPVIWVCFPFLIGMAERMGTGLEDIAAMILLPFNVVLTIILGTMASQSQSELRKLPLAYAADVTGSLRSDVETPASPEVEQSASASLASRTLARLAGLQGALDKSELPEPARGDLARTVGALVERAERLSGTVQALEQALQEHAPTDANLLHQRLERLETLERAGETVPSEERARLERALAAHRDQQEAHDDLESDLTAATASLLEIGAAAARCRRTLLAEPSTAHPELLARLQQEVEQLDAARAEIRGRGLTSRA